MSRRFGVAPCVIAGMHYARGDAVVYMDADLQDPPELLPELIRRWREGADVVYTVRTQRRGESRAKMCVTRAAYRRSSGLRNRPPRRGRRLQAALSASRWTTCSRCRKGPLRPRSRRAGWASGRSPCPTSGSRAERASTHFPLLRSSGPAVVLRERAHLVLLRAPHCVSAARAGRRRPVARMARGGSAPRFEQGRLGGVRAPPLEHPRARDRGGGPLPGARPPGHPGSPALPRGEHPGDRPPSLSSARGRAQEDSTGARVEGGSYRSRGSDDSDSARGSRTRGAGPP